MKQLVTLVFLILIAVPVHASQKEKKLKNPVVLEYIAYPGCNVSDHDHTHEDHSDADHTHHINRFEKKPANEVFKETVEANPDVIAFTCYLDYSSYKIKDRIERKKTLDSFCADRSLLYFRALRSYNEFLIGNMIINGIYDSYGYYPNIINAGITMAAAENKTQSIPIEKSNNTLTATLPGISLEHPISLTLIATKKEKKINISYNPESPDFETYQNVVSGFKHLDLWDGTGRSQTIELDDIQGERFILLAQDEKSGTIHAAGITR